MAESYIRDHPEHYAFNLPVPPGASVVRSNVESMNVLAYYLEDFIGDGNGMTPEELRELARTIIERRTVYSAEVQEENDRRRAVLAADAAERKRVFDEREAVRQRRADKREENKAKRAREGR